MMRKHNAAGFRFQRMEAFFLTLKRKSSLYRHDRRLAIVANTGADRQANIVTLKNIKRASCPMGLFLCASKAAHSWTAKIRWGTTYGVRAKDEICTYCAYRADISSAATGIHHLRRRRKHLSKGVGLHHGYIEQSTIHNSARRYPFHSVAVACGASGNAAFIG